MNVRRTPHGRDNDIKGTILGDEEDEERHEKCRNEDPIHIFLLVASGMNNGRMQIKMDYFYRNYGAQGKRRYSRMFTSN